MKNLITLLAIACIYTFAASAQAQKHEISLGAGLWSPPATEAFNMWDVTISPEMKARTGTTALQFAYQYHFTPRFSIGSGFIYQQINYRLAPELGLLQPHFNDYHFSVLLTGRYTWLSKKRACLYTAGSAGITMRHRALLRDDYGYSRPDILVLYPDRYRFAYQVTAIGIRSGNKIGGFAELGYGYKGIISAGLSYKF